MLTFNNRVNKRITLAVLLGLATAGASYLGYRHYSASATLDQAPETVAGSVITLKQMRETYFVELHHMFSDAIRKGLEFSPVINLGYSIAYFRELDRRARITNGLLYVIFDNQDDKPIGTIEIREYSPDDVGQMGCWINEKYWGHGRIQEAIKLISGVYFRLYPNEKSFIAYARPWNHRSFKALKKAGLVEKGMAYKDGIATYNVLEMHKK